ncbi:condensin-2 complex subunit H2-like protein [Wolffia australiana]
MKDKKGRAEEVDSVESRNGEKFQILQPNRDLEVNWTVDLAKNLEEYLLKICSGEIDADGEEMGNLSINFAEAAMLLQGSIQVYSRKVEYLYHLVLHAMEFLSSEKHDRNEKTSPQLDGGDDHRVTDEDDGTFLGLDDVPVDPKNYLDDDDSTGDCLNHVVKPPPNLVVLEGDCLDTISEASKMESYLLSTCNFYEDFLLVDPYDAETVDSLIRDKSRVKEHSVTRRSSAVKMNSQSSLHSEFFETSGGKVQKSASKKQATPCPMENMSSGQDAGPHSPENLEPGYPDSNDDSDEEQDPWEPLNPHEAGNLRIKPFKRCSIFKRKMLHFNKREPTGLEFPEAKVEGTIDPELAELFKKHVETQETPHSPRSPPLLEKLRQSLLSRNDNDYNVMHDLDDETNEAEAESDHMDSIGADDLDLSQNFINMDVDLHLEKQPDDGSKFNASDIFTKNDVEGEKSLEDLCRSHLDSLLASIVEAEKQTEMAARVSTWKQKIEHTLIAEDSHTPFDIHLYGEKILNKLSEEADDNMVMGFADIVAAQPKNDIARTFSALLQLVNDGAVDLERGSSVELTCFTSANTFRVRLLNRERRGQAKIAQMKRRLKSPPSKKTFKAEDCLKSPLQNGTKGSRVKCSTPEGKRRRRPRLVDLPSAR